MKLSRFVVSTAVCLMLAIAAYAADVAGKWVAQVPGRGGQIQDVTFNFKVNGDQLSGTITSPRGETEISDGKVEGDSISFAQVLNFNGNEMKITYKGKVAGDEIKFTRQREGGDRVQEFTAKRPS
jgi:hypothetical protein